MIIKVSTLISKCSQQKRYAILTTISMPHIVCKTCGSGMGAKRHGMIHPKRSLRICLVYRSVEGILQPLPKFNSHYHDQSRHVKEPIGSIN